MEILAGAVLAVGAFLMIRRDADNFMSSEWLENYLKSEDEAKGDDRTW